LCTDSCCTMCHPEPMDLRVGFIEYEGESPIRINSSLLSVVLHD